MRERARERGKREGKRVRGGLQEFVRDCLLTNLRMRDGLQEFVSKLFAGERVRDGLQEFVRDCLLASYLYTYIRVYVHIFFFTHTCRYIV